MLAREDTLRTSYQRIRQLAGRLINAQEATRAELARELHDGVCQELVSVSLSVNSLKNSSGDIQEAQTQQALSRLEEETIDMLEGVRSMSHDLHPASLRLLGLPAALRDHCSEVAKRYGVEVSLKITDDLGDVHPDTAVSMFRIAQESLRNGIVHGEAQRLALSLARSGNHVELTISDDGWGFDLEAARRDGRGLGLVSMEERAHAVGGDVQIVTEPHKGTTIGIRCPAGVVLNYCPS